MILTTKQLSSGYWHIRGVGPCNWTQPSHWPCSEEMIRSSAHPEASEDFLREAVSLALRVDGQRCGPAAAREVQD
jgi:hypothetical protein